MKPFKKIWHTEKEYETLEKDMQPLNKAWKKARSLPAVKSPVFDCPCRWNGTAPQLSALGKSSKKLIEKRIGTPKKALKKDRTP